MFCSNAQNSASSSLAGRLPAGGTCAASDTPRASSSANATPRNCLFQGAVVIRPMLLQEGSAAAAFSCIRSVLIQARCLGWFEKGINMASETSRRQILKGSLAAAGLGLLGVPEWAIPALAQGATIVPFTDIPANFSSTLSTNANPSRFLD